MIDQDSTDAALVNRAGRGDNSAASMLVLRYTDKVFAACVRVLRRHDAAEDATQETFLRLWKKAPSWKGEGAKLETWLYRVAMNLCIDRLRKEKREVGGEAVPELVDQTALQDDVFLMGEKSKAVAAALGNLPPRQRQALTLCHFQECTNIEAAEIMDISVDALESLLARGRRKLKDILFVIVIYLFVSDVVW